MTAKIDLTDYKTQFESVATLSELHDFMHQMQSESDRYSALWHKSGTNPNSEFLGEIRKADFYASLAKQKILSLAKEGIFLCKVAEEESPEQPDKETEKTETTTN